jgi:hypothetical protein
MICEAKSLSNAIFTQFNTTHIAKLLDVHRRNVHDGELHAVHSPCHDKEQVLLQTRPFSSLPATVEDFFGQSSTRVAQHLPEIALREDSQQAEEAKHHVDDQAGEVVGGGEMKTGEADEQRARNEIQKERDWKNLLNCTRTGDEFAVSLDERFKSSLHIIMNKFNEQGQGNIAIVIESTY